MQIVRYIGKKDVCYMLGCHRSTLDRLRLHDPNFPRAHKRWGKRNAQCKWLEHQIVAYMQIAT
jgi:predicted DNA-binding transcriptional regulator AlpA